MLREVCRHPTVTKIVQCEIDAEVVRVRLHVRLAAVVYHNYVVSECPLSTTHMKLTCQVAKTFFGHITATSFDDPRLHLVSDLS